MTQVERVLQHLKSGKKITPLEALRRFGCFRLGARIHDLKKKGYRIKSELIERHGKRVAQYRMGRG